MTKKKPADTTPTSDKLEALDAINATAARAMVEWLKAGGANIHAAIKTLNETQLKALATIAWSTYTIELRKHELREANEVFDTRQLSMIDTWLGG